MVILNVEVNENFEYYIFSLSDENEINRYKIAINKILKKSQKVQNPAVFLMSDQMLEILNNSKVAVSRDKVSELIDRYVLMEHSSRRIR